MDQRHLKFWDFSHEWTTPPWICQFPKKEYWRDLFDLQEDSVWTLNGFWIPTWCLWYVRWGEPVGSIWSALYFADHMGTAINELTTPTLEQVMNGVIVCCNCVLMDTNIVFLLCTQLLKELTRHFLHWNPVSWSKKCTLFVGGSKIRRYWELLYS